MAKKSDGNGLPDLKKLKINRLYTRVVNEILDDSKSYNGETPKERIIARLGDIERSSECGMVGVLAYPSSMARFFKSYRPEINELLSDAIFNCGAEYSAIFGDKWDTTDPLALEWRNQSLLAWFSYEEVAFRFKTYLENCRGR
jgi:hypothetical protein